MRHPSMSACRPGLKVVPWAEFLQVLPCMQYPIQGMQGALHACQAPTSLSEGVEHCIHRAPKEAYLDEVGHLQRYGLVPVRCSTWGHLNVVAHWLRPFMDGLSQHICVQKDECMPRQAMRKAGLQLHK